MGDEIKLIMNDDGIFQEYNDTWDITIHCTSEEEMNNCYKQLQEAVCRDKIDRMIEEVVSFAESKVEIAMQCTDRIERIINLREENAYRNALAIIHKHCDKKVSDDE